MRSKISNVLWGAFFILIGVLVMGNILDWWQIQFFFRGWWTLFIIIPFAISVIRDGFNAGNVIGLGIGFILLLGQQNLFDFGSMMKLIIPLVLIAIGVAIIFRNNNNHHNCNSNCNNQDKNDYIETNYSCGSNNSSNSENSNAGNSSEGNYIPEIVAIFSGQKKCYNNAIFKGANINALFGGIELDLRTAIIPQNCVINCCTIFGGAEIFFPPNVNVIVHSTPIFGGVTNKTVASAYANAPTVEVRATCVFGGVDLK